MNDLLSIAARESVSVALCQEGSLHVNTGLRASCAWFYALSAWLSMELVPSMSACDSTRYGFYSEVTGAPVKHARAGHIKSQFNSSQICITYFCYRGPLPSPRIDLNFNFSLIPELPCACWSLEDEVVVSDR